MHITDQKYAYHAWPALGNADTGDSLNMGRLSDKTIQFSGTWAGATAVLQGSMDGATWFTLTDPAGVPISFTADAMVLVSENPQFIRPVTSGGAGTSVVCTVGGAVR